MYFVLPGYYRLLHMGILTDLLRSFFYYVGYCYYTEQVPRFRSTYPPFVFFYIRSLCIAHHSPPPFQSNNSLQPLGDSPNLCVISKRPAWPTYILDPLFSFLFLFLLGRTKCIAQHTESRDDMLCSESDCSLLTWRQCHLFLHAIERDEAKDAAWHPPLLYV
jgi:hypothetical protein